MRAPQNIIKRPLLTEKSARLRETGGAAAAPAEGATQLLAQQIVFEVMRDANKIEIGSAIETLFKVKVKGVRTLVVRGKVKRMGRFSGQRPSWKKAYVTLQPGENIAFFEGV